MPPEVINELTLLRASNKTNISHLVELSLKRDNNRVQFLLIICYMVVEGTFMTSDQVHVSEIIAQP